MPEDQPRKSSREHWDDRYGRIGATAVSWYEARPSTSLEMIAAASAGPRSSLIDVGGGSAALVDSLLALGWRDLTVLDISPVALAVAQARVGPSPVHWLVSDVLHWWPSRQYDVWHDRAVFHFLTTGQDREMYRCRLAAAIRPGGHAVIAAFAPDGPESCSQLPVHRYSSHDLAAEFGGDFEVVAERREMHVTPSGGKQPFSWVALRARAQEGEALDALLAGARAHIDRVLPKDLATEVANGALLVDIRPVEQRERDGLMPGAVEVDRNVLEWRTVWTSPHRLPQVTTADLRIILVCNEGYSSSLAAATLRRLGMVRAADLAGGFQAWLDQSRHR